MEQRAREAAGFSARCKGAVRSAPPGAVCSASRRSSRPACRERPLRSWETNRRQVGGSTAQVLLLSHPLSRMRLRPAPASRKAQVTVVRGRAVCPSVCVSDHDLK